MEILIRIVLFCILCGFAFMLEVAAITNGFGIEVKSWAWLIWAQLAAGVIMFLANKLAGND